MFVNRTLSLLHAIGIPREHVGTNPNFVTYGTRVRRADSVADGRGCASTGGRNWVRPPVGTAAAVRPRRPPCARASRRVVELGERRHLQRACPHAVERRRCRRGRRRRRRSACPARTGAASCPSRSASRAAAAGPVRSARRRSSAGAQARQVLDHVGADGVHDVLGVALEHRHEGLDAVELRAPLGPEHRGGEPVLAHGVDAGRVRSSRPGHAAEQLARVDGRARRCSSRTMPAEVRRAATARRRTAARA